MKVFFFLFFRSYPFIHLQYPNGTSLCYGMGCRGSLPGRGNDRIFSLPPHPDHLWSPLILLFSGYQVFFSRGVKMTTYVHLVQGPRICGATLPLPHTPSWR